MNGSGTFFKNTTAENLTAMDEPKKANVLDSYPAGLKDDTMTRK
jgi:hypothetical protein